MTAIPTFADSIFNAIKANVDDKPRPHLGAAIKEMFQAEITGIEPIL